MDGSPERQFKINSRAERMRMRLLDSEGKTDCDFLGQKEVIEMMTGNLEQIEDYYVISKTNARRSFMLAVMFCIFGFALFACAVIIAFYVHSTDFAVITTIGGAISNILAGTAMWVHSGAQKQLNYYYEALHENEQFLSAVYLVSKLSHEKQDEAYLCIIKYALDILADRNKKKEPIKEAVSETADGGMGMG
ncbi:MAG: hypothetical protein LBS21_15510 [Clostridiales bacterium]|jgi:ABC-type multidrug transport system fused ATPase/permease subunit|nr:hypothetical protein [Clostridiales bacterium]